MKSVESRVADPHAVHSFMALAIPEVAALQLTRMLERELTGSMVWLDAALEAGHFDVEPPTGVFGRLPMDNCCGASQALWTLLRAPGRLNGNEVPPGQPVDEAQVLRDTRASFRPNVPDGFEGFMQRLTDRIEASCKRHIEMKPKLGERLHKRACDELGTVLALAIALDDVAMVRRTEELLVGHGLAAADIVVPRHVLDQHRELVVHRDMLFRPGTVALHFGANQVLDHCLDCGWNPAKDAVRWGAMDGYLGDRFSVLRVLSTASTRLQPSSLYRVCERLDFGNLDHDDQAAVQRFLNLLPQAARTPAQWATIVQRTGLVQVDPVDAFCRAAGFCCIEMLEATKDRLDWTDLESLGRHPVIRVVGGDPSNPDHFHILRPAVDACAAWFIHEAVQRGPTVFEALCAATDSQRVPLPHMLLRSDRLSLLGQLLEAGLNPTQRPYRDMRSLLDTAMDSGNEDALALMRSVLARTQARQAAQICAAGAAGANIEP